MQSVALTPTLRDARAAHFAQSGFSAEDYAHRWARFKNGPVTVVFPNWASRGRALSLHDLHHALTGYDTTLVGEAEVAAWELANGCGRHLIAWVLEAQAFGFGLLRCPRRLYRAFMRGRGGGNLFGYRNVNPVLLNSPLPGLRTELGLDLKREVTWEDRLAFVLWSLIGLVSGAIGLALVLLPITWIAYFGFHLAYALDTESGEKSMGDAGSPGSLGVS